MENRSQEREGWDACQNTKIKRTELLGAVSSTGASAAFSWVDKGRMRTMTCTRQFSSSLVLLLPLDDDDELEADEELLLLLLLPPAAADPAAVGRCLLGLLSPPASRGVFCSMSFPVLTLAAAAVVAIARHKQEEGL